MSPIAVIFLTIITLLFVAAVIGPRIEARLNRENEE